MKRKRFDTILTYVALTLLLFLIQRALGEASRGVANLFSYERFDPDHAYLGNMVHHTAMMLLTLTAVLFLKKVDKLEFGLGLGDKKAGFRYVALYTAVFAGITLVVHVLMRISNSLPVYAFPLNRRNIIGTLVFQLFFTGPAEELLFRALPITIIVAVLGRSVDSGLGISLETIIAALLFALAHAKWSLFPLIVEADLFPLLYAFGQGIISGKVYQETHSIVYPMAMHSISNILMVQTGYLFLLLS
jgi:membrane protease YdiL (CAAX protease family)